MTRALALYIHWPFCRAKCPYCDFNSHAFNADDIPQARWRRALLRELDGFAEQLKDDGSPRQLESIFFGGGTPSLMEPATMGAIIERATSHWSGAADLEITFEANPTSVEIQRLHDYASAGANRVSIGVQALNDDALRFLGREHSQHDAREALRAAGNIFSRLSFDLIYARPGQSEKMWEAELADGLRLANDIGADHLSLYQLGIERGTPFAKQNIPAADEETGVALYELTQALCAQAGYDMYEISNHARTHGQCRHNVNIWRGQDYVGVGPGAHGRMTLGHSVYATCQTPKPDRWLEMAENPPTGLAAANASFTALNAHERIEEVLMGALRLRDGIDDNTFTKACHTPLRDALDEQKLTPLIEGGFLSFDGKRLWATDSGRMRLNAVLGALLV